MYSVTTRCVTGTTDQCPTCHSVSRSSDPTSVKMMFSVRRSTVPIDLVTFPDGDDDPGMGVFQRVLGAFTLKVIGDTVQSIDKTDIHPRQGKYQMDSGYDEDKVIVPTLESILSGEIAMSFRVQHSRGRPTHRMDWFEDTRGRDYPFSFLILHLYFVGSFGEPLSL